MGSAGTLGGAATVKGAPGHGRPGRAHDLTNTSTAQGTDGPHPLGTEALRPGEPMYRDAARYEILGEHGRGGLGRVLRARDLELGRDVAVKELLEPGVGSELRFFREALITARLEHPGIVPVHEAGHWPDGTPFYAMKLVQGRSLRALIDERPTLAERLALLPNVVAVANAVAYAHDRRIIHRDLKPSNVIVGDFGETVVIDWGLAKDLTAADGGDVVGDAPARAPLVADGLTSAGAILGTPAYMPPEQARGDVVDERADVFALGAVLLHVVTGRAPTPGRAPAAGLGVAAPRDLVAIVARAMSADAAARYPSASAFADDLGRYLRREAVSARRYSIAARAALRVARHRGVALVALAALAALSITLGVAAVRVSAQKAVALDERRAATAARDDAEAARDALVLRNAELLLTRDPTRARQALAGYDGPDRAAAAFYDALARAAGSAERELTPHADAIFGVATAPGDAIISAGDDGAVKVTREDGSIETIETVPTISSPIALSAATGCVATVEPDRRLRLRCPPDFTPIAVPDVDAARIAFSPDGGTLVTLAEGKLVVWRVEQDPELRLERSGAAAMLAGDEVTFAGPSTILRVRDHDVTAMPTHGMEAPSSAKLTFARPIDAVAASSRLAAVVTNDDQMQLLSLPELHPLRTLRPCDADVVEVVVAAESPSFSVACSDGKVVTGDVWGRQSVSFVTIRRPSLLAISDAGTLVSVTDATNVLYVHDVERNLTWTLRGHETGITYARLPDRRDDRVITGDAGGTIRIWRLPDPLGHVACTVPTVPFHARLLPDEASVVVDGEDGVVRVCGAGGNVEALPGRAELYYGLVLDEQGTMVAASGLDVVSVWRVDDHRLLRQFRGHHGQTAARFLRDGSLLSWGEDGDVWRWSAAGDEASMLSLADFPIASFRWVGASNEIMFAGRRGPVMVAGLDGSASRVVQPSSDDLLTALGISRGATWVVTGDEHGTVRVNGPDATTPSRLHLDAPIHRVAVAPSGQYWAATTERGRLVLATTAPTSGEGTLLDFSIGARGVAFSADGNVLAVPLASGTVCFLHIATIDWQCSASTGAELLSGNFDREDRHFIAVDSEGRVIDLGMTNLFETTGPDDN